MSRESTLQKTHTAFSAKPITHYNLDVVISVGYRVKLQRGTQFRIWASSVLKEYLIKGYALNQRRLVEQGVAELRGVLDLLASTLEQHQLTDATGLAVVELVRRYGLSWQFLLQYDEDRLTLPSGLTPLSSLSAGVRSVRYGPLRQQGAGGLALLVAASDPRQKDVLIRLIINLLSPSAAGGETGQR